MKTMINQHFEKFLQEKCQSVPPNFSWGKGVYTNTTIQNLFLTYEAGYALACTRFSTNINEELKVPKIGTELEGGIFAGIVADETEDYALILLPATTQPLNWNDAVKWAKSVGGNLPTCSEQAILYGNLKKEFEPRWYWTCEQDADDDVSYAWVQYFYDGNQGYDPKSYEYRARAVRRIHIG